MTCLAALAADQKPTPEATKRAIEQSQMTLPGSHQFHLKAKVVEATNLENDDYKAEIEEYWSAPSKWRRTVKTASFSQTLTVNGDKVREDLSGDYYPNWLRTMVNAIFDPGAPWQGVDLSKSSDNPMIGGTQVCRRFAFRAGIPPVGNNVFSTFCLERGLIASVGKPGYHAEYKSYKKFAGKQVARKIREYIEPGTELEASVEELTELDAPDESLFSVQEPNEQLETIAVSEETLRGIGVNMPPMEWPTIRGGKSSGVLSIYVCIDRKGRVRETYALNSDHPEMSDAARKQVMNWEFKPTANKGASVQIEAILTFAYETKVQANAGASLGRLGSLSQ